jgi:hypothetical protein
MRSESQVLLACLLDITRGLMTQTRRSAGDPSMYAIAVSSLEAIDLQEVIK